MLDNVVGQERAKDVLKLLSHGYHRRGMIPPIGVFGESGLGKTHLVYEWGEEIGAKVIYINGTAVKDALGFRAFFSEARDNPSQYYLMFVDEAHRLPRRVQDNLLSVLEKPSILCTIAVRDMGIVKCVGGISQYVSKGDIMREELPNNMSFIFATTEKAELQKPILNRLRALTLTEYTIENKIEIAIKHLAASQMHADMSIYTQLAERSRSIRHLKDAVCETYMDVKSLYPSSNEEAMVKLDDLLGIDAEGATDQDMDYLDYLTANEAVGVDTMAGKLRVNKKDIVENVEPFLLAKGWIQITGRGRTLTEAGRNKVLAHNDTSSR